MFLLPLFLVAAVAHSDTETHTVFRFSRSLDTCDAQDKAIPDSTVRVIWAYNDDDPVNENPKVHDQRGIASVPLHNRGLSNQLEDGATSIDIVGQGGAVEFGDMGDARTSYWCSGHTVDVGANKRHIVRYAPIIPVALKKNAHHVLVYICSTPLDDSWVGPCNADTNPDAVKNCKKDVFAVWAYGSPGFDFPLEAGFPVQGELTLLMEWHYDNPEGKTLHHDLGVRFWTVEPRQHDAGIMVIGSLILESIIIPKGKSDHVVNTYCPTECTDNIVEDGLTIFSGFLHTHQRGRKVRARQIRNGVELAPIQEDLYYDFNAQLYVPLPSVQILPGDGLLLQCHYDTSDATEDVTMGWGTPQEMCLAFLYYYPAGAPQENSCYSYDFADSATPENGRRAYCPGLHPEAEVPFNASIPSFTEYEPPLCTYTAPTKSVTPTVKGGPIEDDEYAFSQYLDSDNKFKLHWTRDDSEELIHFAVDVATSGWVGFGFTDSSMAGADVVIGWIDDDGAHFADRKASVAGAVPAVDEKQDYFSVTGVEIEVEHQHEDSSSGAAALGASLSLLLLCLLCLQTIL